MKDKNFIEINEDKDGELLKLPGKVIEECLTILKLDSIFLSSKDLMDYSMLLGIEHIDLDLALEQKNATNQRGIYSSDVQIASNGSRYRQIYYISMIDYLQNFSLQKKLETLTNKLSANAEDRSALPPN